MKFVGIFYVFLSLLTPASFAQTTQTASNVVYLSQEENQFYVMLNQFRAELGLPTVQIHVFLQNAAQKHSAWMASQNFLTHYGPLNNETPFQRMEDEGYTKYTYAGENVACGNADAVKTFRQWAFSPGHLANMVNPHFHHIGISRAGTGNEQCPYFWTNDFGSMTDISLDPAAVTDLQKIAKAIADVSGAIPSDQQILLPVVQQNGVVDENATATATQPNYSLIQCMIPYALSKNILSFVLGTDALLEITPNPNGGYQGKVSYIQNGASTTYYPMMINSVSVLTNASYPLISIFAGAGGRTGGFIIQIDSSKSSAEFNPYPSSSTAASGSVVCSYKI